VCACVYVCVCVCVSVCVCVCGRESVCVGMYLKMLKKPKQKHLLVVTVILILIKFFSENTSARLVSQREHVVKFFLGIVAFLRC